MSAVVEGVERGLNLLLDILDLGRSACARRRMANERARAKGQSQGVAAHDAMRNAGPAANARRAGEIRFRDRM